jgi:hypothetical protein
MNIHMNDLHGIGIFDKCMKSSKFEFSWESKKEFK